MASAWSCNLRFARRQRFTFQINPMVTASKSVFTLTISKLGFLSSTVQGLLTIDSGIERGMQPFLTANWRYVAMLNYIVDPRLLAPLVPSGTEIDFENGDTFLSIVGFLFLDTRLLGLAIPLHRDFEEVNLRFYVRRKSADTWRRGVVFIRELVPGRAIALVARAFYG